MHFSHSLSHKLLLKPHGSGSQFGPKSDGLFSPHYQHQKCSSFWHSWHISIRSSLGASQEQYLSESDTWYPILPTQLPTECAQASLRWKVSMFCIYDRAYLIGYTRYLDQALIGGSIRTSSFRIWHLVATMVNPARTASEHSSTAHAIKTLKNTNVLHLWWSISPWVDQVSGPSLDRRLCQNQLHQNLTLGCQSREPSAHSKRAQHGRSTWAQAIKTPKNSNGLHL